MQLITLHKIESSLFCLALAVPSVCLLLMAANAYAGGTEVGDLGTVAMGRGTAFVARSDNLSAFYYNPAGLSKSKGPNLLLVGNVVNQNVDYERMGNGAFVKLDDNGLPDYGQVCGDDDLVNRRCVKNPQFDYRGGISSLENPRGWKPISLEKRFGPQPMLVFSWGGIGKADDLALALGAFAPPGFGTPAYSKEGAQRYVVRGGNLMMLLPGVGISYAFNRYIQLGAVFLSGFGVFEQNQAIRLEMQPEDVLGNEDAGGDADLTFDIHDYFIPTGIVGILSNPLDWLEIGLSVRLPIKVAAKGEVKYDAPEGDMQNSVLVAGRDKITMTQVYPWMVRAGARYIHRLFDVEVDFVWENWRSYRAEYEIDAAVDNEGQEIDFTAKGELLKNFRDTYSIRIGGDVEVWPEHIAVRIGGFYTSSAYPKNYETVTIDAPYGEEFGLGGGLTVHAFRFLDIHVGYLHIFQLDIAVEEGIIQQLGPTAEVTQPDGSTKERNLGNIINNGNYEVSFNTFGVALEGHF